MERVGGPQGLALHALRHQYAVLTRFMALVDDLFDWVESEAGLTDFPCSKTVETAELSVIRWPARACSLRRPTASVPARGETWDALRWRIYSIYWRVFASQVTMAIASQS